MKFMNHESMKDSNAYADYIRVEGKVHILIYAKRDIKIGEEIFFDYGDCYQISGIPEFNERKCKNGVKRHLVKNNKKLKTK